MSSPKFKIGDVVQYMAYPYEGELGVVELGIVLETRLARGGESLILFGDEKRWVLTYWLCYPKD